MSDSEVERAAPSCTTPAHALVRQSRSRSTPGADAAEPQHPVSGLLSQFLPIHVSQILQLPHIIPLLSLQAENLSSRLC